MDSFAAVLTTLSCSSMYEVMCVKRQISWLMSNDRKCICVNDLLFLIGKLKINHKTPLGI
jgi:hypothetical protein